MEKKVNAAVVALGMLGTILSGHVFALEERPLIVEGDVLPSERLALPDLAGAETPAAAERLTDAALSAEDQVSLGQAMSLARRAIRRVTEGQAEMEQNRDALFLASNPYQHLGIRFTEQGPRISSTYKGRDWQALFRLSDRSKPEVIAAKGTRLEYSYGNVIAWYDNRSDGLEQGFILTERAVEAGDHVELRVAVEGLALRGDGESLLLADADGRTVLSYGKLKVWDADGRVLPSTLAVGSNDIIISVDDARARYPITIDPLIVSQEATLGPAVTGSGSRDDHFGHSVSISGDTVVVGAYQDDNVEAESGTAYVFLRTGTVWSLQQRLTAYPQKHFGHFGYSVSIAGDTLIVGTEDSRCAYVFSRTGAVWSQQQKLEPNDRPANESFGRSVSLWGDTAIVGAELDDDRGSYSGSVYVFVRSGSAWTQQRKLTAGDGAAYDYFGRSVSIESNTVVVGAHGNDDSGYTSGSAYVFVRSGSIWTQQEKLSAPDGAAWDHFGYSVSVSKDTVIVGAHEDDDDGEDSGSAHVYVRSGTDWNHEAKLTSTNAAAGDYFGHSVSVADDTVVVGAYGDDDNGSESGSAYVFVRSGTNWNPEAKLVAGDGASYDYFGHSVAVAADTVVVGVYRDDDTGEDSGSASVFTRNGGIWGRQQKLTGGDAAAGDYFGGSVSISGDTALVGAYGDDDGRGEDSGSAYVFIHTGGVWNLQQKLTAGDGADSDWFGSSVSLSGDTALIGARGDDVGSTNGQGSAYVFTRTGGVWNLQQKLTASDGAYGDGFGKAVSLDGDAAVIGAWLDTTRTTTAHGSAYVFTRTGGVWGEQQRLTASDAGVGDRFGAAVSIAGDTIVVGAYSDDTGTTNDQGSAYVFVRTGGVWNQQQKLTAADGSADDWFGASVSVSDDTALIGSYKDDTGSTNNHGSAYVFARAGGVWSEQQKLVAGDGAANDEFGYSVAVSGNTAVIGADRDSTGSISTHGSAYVFTRVGGIWHEQHKLLGGRERVGSFGYSVSLWDNVVLVGARQENGGPVPGGGSVTDQGRAYIFRLTDDSAIPDLDSDGIDDRWESRYGLSSGNPNDATNNPDGDLFDNLSEYIADTNPTNPASFFRIGGLEVHSPATLSWQGSTARVYSVAYRSNLVSGSWQPLVADLQGSNLMSVMDGANTPPRFYRVGVSLP